MAPQYSEADLQMVQTAAYAAGQSNTNAAGAAGGYDSSAAASAKEFYLTYGDFLEDVCHSLRGDSKVGEEWIKNPAPLMSDAALADLRGFFNVFMSINVKLADIGEDTFRKETMVLRRTFARWLFTRGGILFGINKSNFEMIFMETHGIITYSLTWALNRGGRRFINESISSKEHVAYMVNGSKRQDNNMRKIDVNPW